MMTCGPPPAAILSGAAGCTDGISAATWSKLLLPVLLPRGMLHVLYLDCDVLATVSLWPLWDEARAAMNGVSGKGGPWRSGLHAALPIWQRYLLIACRGPSPYEQGSAQWQGHHRQLHAHLPAFLPIYLPGGHTHRPSAQSPPYAAQSPPGPSFTRTLALGTTL